MFLVLEEFHEVMHMEAVMVLLLKDLFRLFKGWNWSKHLSEHISCIHTSLFEVSSLAVGFGFAHITSDLAEMLHDVGC